MTRLAQIRRAPAFALALAVAIPGCQSGAAGSGPTAGKASAADTKAGADTKTGADTKPTAKPPPADGTAAGSVRATFAKPNTAEARAQRKSLVLLRNEGQKLVKKKDLKAAIDRYTMALEIDPTDAATLGELGWAAFLAGELDKAEEALRKSLHHTEKDQTRGAVLYNLGRVLEERGDKDAAARAYEQSLTHRENKVVAQRLASLKEAGANAEADDKKHCEFTTHEGVAPDRLCKAYVAMPAILGQVEGPDALECNEGDLYEREVAVAAGEELPDNFDPKATKIALEIDGSKGVWATTFGYRDYDLMGETFVLVISQGTKWHTFPFALANHPGVSYADEWVGGIKLSTEQLVPGGAPELVVRWEVSAHDGDIELNEDESSVHKYVGVVSLEGTPTWLATVTEEFSYSVDIFLDELEADRKAEGIEHSELLGNESKKAVGVTWLRDKGAISVKATGKDGASAPTGEHALGAYPELCPEPYGL